MSELCITQDTLLKQIALLAFNHSDIQVVWLYGSRANDNFSDHSDFDIAIAFKNFDLSITDRYLRPNELAIDWSIELNVAPELLSIVDINQAPIYLAFNIVEYGFPIYVDGSTRAVKEQSRIYSQYEFQMRESKRNA